MLRGCTAGPKPSRRPRSGAAPRANKTHPEAISERRRFLEPKACSTAAFDTGALLLIRCRSWVCAWIVPRELRAALRCGDKEGLRGKQPKSKMALLLSFFVFILAFVLIAAGPREMRDGAAQIAYACC